MRVQGHIKPGYYLKLPSDTHDNGHGHKSSDQNLLSQDCTRGANKTIRGNIFLGGGTFLKQHESSKV